MVLVCVLGGGGPVVVVLVAEDDIDFTTEVRAVFVGLKIVVEDAQNGVSWEVAGTDNVKILKTVSRSGEENISESVELVKGGQGSLDADAIVAAEDFVSEANRDINERKRKLDTGGESLADIRAANEAADKQQQAAAAEFVVQTTKEGILAATSNFPPLSSSHTKITPDALKTYVTSQIVEYLGGEELDLIEFVMKELNKGCTTAALLEEMKMVLDEDAEEFVLGLYRKMVE